MNFRQLTLSLLLCSVSAFATSVDYTTSGMFSSDSLNAISTGGETITFNGITSSVDVSTPTFSSLGTFVVTGNVMGSFTDTFTLTINQTLPSAGNGSSQTNITGKITGNSSTIQLVFMPAAVDIGPPGADALYTFAPQDYGLNNPSVNNGNTTIEAYITSAPEPASVGLLGGSLVGLALLIRRRMAKGVGFID